MGIAYICDGSDERFVTRCTFAPGKPETTRSYVSRGWIELVNASSMKIFEEKMVNITFLPEIRIVGQTYFHTL